MPELTPAELKQQLATRVDAIGKYFERNISDNITQYIFGGTKVARYVKRVTDYASYFNNIFSLAFIFAHGCLRCDNDSEYPINPKATKQNSLRIINSLRKAYVQYPVTSELIQFVLSDIQFEMLQGNDSELYEIFENLCAFRSHDFSLSKYYKVIAQWKAAPSRFNMDGNELAVMFQKLLQNMTFLKKYDLIQDEDGNFSFIDKDSLEFGEIGEKYSMIPVGHLIYFDPDLYLDMYSLFSLEKNEDDGVKKLGLRYVSGDGFKSLSFLVSEEEPQEDEDPETRIIADASDYYYNILGEDWDYTSEDPDSKKNSNFIDQVHAINYKYIKNLALAISDTISVNRGSKRALYNAYHIRHRDVFKEVTDQLSLSPDIESIKLDWDGIIVMLLIESSPSSVLETLFRAVPQTFIAVARNLCKRIDNPENPIHNKSEQELTQLVNDIIHTKLILGETSGFGKIPQNTSDDRLFARAASLLIISSLSAVHEEETVEKSICAGNIYDNISLLKRMKSDVPTEQRCKYVCIILAETFRHLLCFYRGLLAYGEIKAKFDAETCNHCFSETQIASYQKKLQKAFIQSAKAEADSIQCYNSSEHADMLMLLNRFTALCEECSSSIQSATSNGHHLYAALGKHDLLNLPEFKAHTQAFIQSYDAINGDNVDEWIAFALEILRYLRRNSFKHGGETPFHAIYPFTAIYNRGNENYDGYKTVTFTLNIDVDGDDRVDSKEYINVLTEFTYNLSNVFYCLPNVLRSNRRWWIDPVLINFKEFNDIFVD